MKVLVVTIDKAEFSEEASYRIALQGKVFSDVSELSSSPTFKTNVLRVPFAVVRNGQEVLVATVHRCVKGPNGEDQFERVGQGAAPLHAPSKTEKSGVIKIEEDVESSVINGNINVSYKLIRITMRD